MHNELINVTYINIGDLVNIMVTSHSLCTANPQPQILKKTYTNDLCDMCSRQSTGSCDSLKLMSKHFRITFAQL